MIFPAQGQPQEPPSQSSSPSGISAVVIGRKPLQFYAGG